MNKKTINKFGEHYLIGIDSEGVYHYLEAPSWDCGWYWGFGYIHTFTNNRSPELSKDINSHYQMDSLKFNPKPSNLVDTPFNDKEWYQLWELSKTIYSLREIAAVYNRGGSHITSNPLSEMIKNNDECDRINKILIPALWSEMVKILEGVK